MSLEAWLVALVGAEVAIDDDAPLPVPEEAADAEDAADADDAEPEALEDSPEEAALLLPVTPCELAVPPGPPSAGSGCARKL